MEGRTETKLGILSFLQSLHTQKKKKKEVNLASWSDTIEVGTPCNQTISRTYNWAHRSTRNVLLIGMSELFLQVYQQWHNVLVLFK